MAVIIQCLVQMSKQLVPNIEWVRNRFIMTFCKSFAIINSKPIFWWILFRFQQIVIKIYGTWGRRIFFKWGPVPAVMMRHAKWMYLEIWNTNQSRNEVWKKQHGRTWQCFFQKRVGHLKLFGTKLAVPNIWLFRKTVWWKPSNTLDICFLGQHVNFWVIYSSWNSFHILYYTKHRAMGVGFNFVKRLGQSHYQKCAVCCMNISIGQGVFNLWQPAWF